VFAHFWKSFSGKANASNVHLRWKKAANVLGIIKMRFHITEKYKAAFSRFYSNFDVENGKITNPELDNQLKEIAEFQM
jgi:hypothetical protein